ncbi:MAG: pectinesterase family protein [Faecalibacterium prausnitzii]
MFWDCDFVSDNCPAGTVFLGRPWRPTGKTAALDCRLGAHIAPEGFSPWQSRTDSDLCQLCRSGQHRRGAAARGAWVKQAGQPAGRRAAQMCTEALAGRNKSGKYKIKYKTDLKDLL